jgi:hypothetical protein
MEERDASARTSARFDFCEADARDWSTLKRAMRSLCKLGGGVAVVDDVELLSLVFGLREPFRGGVSFSLLPCGLVDVGASAGAGADTSDGSSTGVIFLFRVVDMAAG